MSVSHFELVRRVAALPPTISGTARLLLHTLILHRNARTGECFPTYPTLAREMGVSVRTVKYAAERLAAAGLLTVGKRKTRDGDGNTYALTLPAIPADSATVAPTNNQQTVQSTTGRRCNLRPQTVQSATADSATVAPKQISNIVPNRESAIAHALSVRCLIEIARRIGVPEGKCSNFAYMCWMKWDEHGMKAGANFDIPVTPQNVETLMRRYWECDYENERRTVRDGV